MTTTAPDHSRALDEIFDAMPSEARDRVSVMEAVKARVVRTPERDAAVGKAFDKQLADLVTRVDPAKPRGPGNRSEARMLVLTGRTGAGKTALLHRLISAHPSFPGYGEPDSGCRAVSVSTPSPCTPKALGIEILRMLGFPLVASRALPYVYGKVRERLELLGVLVLHLDEVHSVTETANRREGVQLRNMLKSILVSGTWPVALVLSGHPEMVAFLEGATEFDEKGRPKADTKGELRRRSMFVDLPSLTSAHAPMVAGALADVAAVAGLGVPGDVENVIVPRLLHAGLHELGTVMQLCHEAIHLALAAPERPLSLGVEQFADAYAGRTGCAAGANPFVSPSWRSLDCRLVLKKSLDAARLPELPS